MKNIDDPAFAGVVPDGAVPGIFQSCPVDVCGRGHSGAAKAPLADFNDNALKTMCIRAYNALETILDEALEVFP